MGRDSNYIGTIFLAVALGFGASGIAARPAGAAAALTITYSIGGGDINTMMGVEPVTSGSLQIRWPNAVSRSMQMQVSGTGAQ